jgi:transcriptional regulator
MTQRPPPLPPPVPSERAATVREALCEELRQGFCTAKELSTRVGISEKDVAAHLEHLAKSLKARVETLEVQPPSCIACGFSFKHRSRMTRPGKCPECGETRIDPPQFRVQGA